MGRYLRIIRIIVSAACFALLTGFLSGSAMTIPAAARFLARIQFVPATMSFAIAIFILWLLVTLIFGRIYCSTVCPMGTLQDIFARVPRLTSAAGRRRPFTFSPPLNIMRYTALAIIFSSLLAGFTQLLSLSDPFAIFQRFADTIIRPVITMTAASFIGAIISLVLVGLIGWLAARNGRTFCNSICPAGTTLSFPARYSIFHIDIDPDKCVQCRKCEHSCKAACIDVPAHTVDTSRCVTCFNCVARCPNDAIRYTWQRHQLAYPLLQRIDGAMASAADRRKNPQSVVPHSDNSPSK